MLTHAHDGASQSVRSLPATVGAPRVHAAQRHPQAEALRSALAYGSRGSSKLDVLAARFGMDRADVSRALNTEATPRRIRERLTDAEAACWYAAIGCVRVAA